MQHSNTAGCILLKFYIKPQHTANVYNLLYVVSYRNSTSNHNMSHWRATSQGVVSYRNSTSNHNWKSFIVCSRVVVSYRNSTSNHNIYVVRSLIAPVVSYRNSTSNHNNTPCLVPSFSVVSYRNSTSNHNYGAAAFVTEEVVSYRNSTSNHNSSFYKIFCVIVVSYRNSTSNHNFALGNENEDGLYLIEILHQTTTGCRRAVGPFSCILSKFYIKPQPSRRDRSRTIVVSYRNSTSNHNSCVLRSFILRVVSYRNSTSNHNQNLLKYSVFTLYLIEILHQTTTSGLILIDKVLLTGCLPL